MEPRGLRAQVGLLNSIAADAPIPPVAAEPLAGDPDDDRILACAIASGVDVIAAGNRRHLLPLGERQGVRILTPQALLAELRRRGNHGLRGQAQVDLPQVPLGTGFDRRARSANYPDGGF